MIHLESTPVRRLERLLGAPFMGALVCLSLLGCGGGGASTSGASAVNPAAAVASTSPVAAAATPPASANDFAPPQARDTSAEPEAPGSFRLRSARSTDGLTWTQDAGVISEQANVPDMVVDAQGRIWLYYVGGQVGTRSNCVALAVSSDGGRTWTFRYVNPPASLQHAGDPDVILLPDGSFRLFLTTMVNGRHGVVCLESANGVDLTLRNTAFADAGLELLDSTTYQAGGLWHMLTLEGTGMTQRHGTSTDGRSFTVLDPLPFHADGHDYIGSNPVSIGGSALRMYGFALDINTFRSFTSSDGVTWTVEPGVRLQSTGQQIKDPSVVQLADGSWLMVYTERSP